MTSNSSRQCPALLELGALLLTEPRLCPSSCAATLGAQQPESLRPYDGPPLLRLFAVGRSSPANEPMPQYVLSSANIMYLRSARLYPNAFSALFVDPKSLIAVAATSASRTSTWQSEVVTNRRWRTPPVS